MSGGRYGPAKTPERRCMPMTLWPETDRTVWERALTPGTILDDDLGSLTHLSPTTNRKTEKGYGRFLTYCSFHERECLAEPVDRRIDPERVKRYVAHLQDLGNSTHSILCRLQELGDAVRVLDPEVDWTFINRIASRIRARHKPARDKSRIVMSDELATLGYDLMERAAALDGFEAAVQYRDGLMIAMLAYVPIRRKNFTSLTLGQSLVHRQGHWFVVLSPDETKTHAHFETALPPSLTPHLEYYLDHHREVLASRTGRWLKPLGDALWVSAHGSPMTQMAVYDRICRHTRARFGQGISPHLFRDAAATTLRSAGN
jgi:integrase/recombinase XerD